MFTPELTQGVFIEEIKNRFLCLIDVNGVDTLCYIPSSCRLSNFIDLKGKKVLLVPTTSKNARTKYSVFAVEANGRPIPLNMSLGNLIVYDSIKNKRFSFLGKRSVIHKEYTIGAYKCDAFIEDTSTIIEIKSFLSFSAEAVFPTVFSQRAVDQLKEIEQLLERGYSACYILVSLNSVVKRVFINQEFDEYYSQLRHCLEKGMLIKGLSLRLADGTASINRQINVVI